MSLICCSLSCFKMIFILTLLAMSQQLLQMNGLLEKTQHHYLYEIYAIFCNKIQMLIINGTVLHVSLVNYDKYNEF